MSCAITLAGKTNWNPLPPFNVGRSKKQSARDVSKDAFGIWQKK